jgi:hypothetical protein
MDLEFATEYFETTPSTARKINVIANGVDVMDIAKEVIGDLDAETIVKLFGDNEALLDEIGIDFVKDYFDLKETEED